MLTRLIFTTAIGLGLVGTGVAAVAQTATAPVASKSDWTIFVNDNPKQCWIVSPPMVGKSTATRDGRPVAVTRGDIYLFVSFWSANGQGSKGEISFLGGYDFAEGKPVKLTIGDNSFDLFSEGNTAWATSPEEDRKIASAMKAGAQAVLTGTSQRSGTVTTDTFSLMGFTAAYEDALGRCGK